MSTLLEDCQAVEPDYNGVSAWSVLDEVDNVELVEDVIIGEGRWESHNRAVFKRGEEYVAFEYSAPLTEMQEGGDQTICEFYNVVPTEVSVIEYVKA